MHRLSIEGSYNVRDLGGYPTSDGRVIRSQALIRAGNLDKVTATGQQQLIDYGIRTVIDLRDEWEVRRFPNMFAQSTAVNYLNLPFRGEKYIDDWETTTQDEPTLQDIYCVYLDRCQQQVGAIITAIAESTPAVVFHCHAGKDRTGLIAGLVLAAVGVPAQIIADDYAETTSQADHTIVGIDWNAEPETMLNTLNYLQEHYGSVSNYLRACGITNVQLEDMEARFVI